MEELQAEFRKTGDHHWGDLGDLEAFCYHNAFILRTSASPEEPTWVAKAAGRRKEKSVVRQIEDIFKAAKLTVFREHGPFEIGTKYDKIKVWALY